MMMSDYSRQGSSTFSKKYQSRTDHAEIYAILFLISIHGLIEFTALKELLWLFVNRPIFYSAP